MFDELLRQPGVTEQLELRSRFGFLAFHGGSLEEGTDVVASAAAEAADASLWAVRQPDDLRWHVPSRAVSPEHSAALVAFLDHVEVAVAVHGFGREGYWTSLLVGGGNRALATHVAGHLRPALPGYDVVDDLDRVPIELRGVHPDNPVNLPVGGGTQLELPPRVRGEGPTWDGHRDRRAGRLVPPMVALIDALAAAARSWPLGQDPAARPGKRIR